MPSNRAFAILILVATAGCASTPPVQILTPFHDDDFSLWKQNGPHTVTGLAFVKRPDGTVFSCAGAQVSLIPAVAYNTELEQVLALGTGYPPNYDRHERKYDHKTVCDSTGKFVFDGIPALNWIAITRITWQEPSSIPYMGQDEKGGYLFGEIRVDATHTSITLTNDDFVADKN